MRQINQKRHTTQQKPPYSPCYSWVMHSWQRTGSKPCQESCSLTLAQEESFAGPQQVTGRLSAKLEDAKMLTGLI